VTNGSTTEDGVEQTYKHRARDAMETADLRLYGFRQASMSRGVEVRGSEHFCLRTLRRLECALDPGVPRALGSLRVAAKMDDGLPGAGKEHGRWRTSGFFPLPARRGEEVKKKSPYSHLLSTGVLLPPGSTMPSTTCALPPSG
jgi:hypothetical protein